MSKKEVKKDFKIENCEKNTQKSSTENAIFTREIKPITPTRFEVKYTDKK